MAGRDEINLTAEERAVLADLEASAAEDRRLVKQLDSRHRRLRLAALPGWSRTPLWAIPLIVAGLAITLLSLSTTVALGGVGIVMTAVGLWLIARWAGRRWFHEGRAPG